jgi:Putative zinc-finger
MVNKSAINCEHVWNEVSNYVEGEVEAGLRASMDEHFHTCAKCRSVLEGMRNVIQLYGDERMIEVPAGFSRRLERRLIQSAKISNRGWSVWSAWLVPAAAMLLIAGGVRIASSVTVPHPMLSEKAQPAYGIPADMVVVVSEGAKDFHRPGCDVIHNKDRERTLTARDAIREGYVPCVRCLRKYLETALKGRTTLEREARESLEADAKEFYVGQ